MDEARPFGVTLIGGFLGAGKTTLLARILRDPEAGRRRLGVLVNDFGDLPVDAALVTELREGVMRLSSGCVCCSMQSDLMRALMAMKDGGEVDHVIIETSGVADTQVLAGQLLELEQSGVLRLDAVLGVVDAEAFPRLLDEHRALGRAQVRAADLVLVNKADLVDEARAAEVEAAVRAIAPRARIVRTVQSALPLDVVVGGDDRPARVGDARTNGHVHQDHAHLDDAHQHQDAVAHDALFSAWTFRTSKPLTWRVLGPLLAQLPDGVFRAKGTINIVEREGMRVLLHVVGGRLHVRSLPGPIEDSAIVFVGTRVRELTESLEKQLQTAVV